MRLIHCEQCGVEVEAQRSTKRFCAACRAERERQQGIAKSKRYRQAHPERHRAAASRYAKDHRDQINARARAYAAAHPGYNSAKRRAYYARHRDQCLMRAARWRKSHAEAERIRKRQWQAAHLDVQRACARRYRAEHRERLNRIARCKSANSRAKASGVPGKLTVAQVLQLERNAGGRCYYCGQVAKLETEHKVPFTRGGANDLDNIVLACHPCNARKGRKTADEYLALLRDEQAQEHAACTQGSDE